MIKLYKYLSYINLIEISSPPRERPFLRMVKVAERQFALICG
jgi:hypothetical protein